MEVIGSLYPNAVVFPVVCGKISDCVLVNRLLFKAELDETEAIEKL